jgi:hypothetical protein
VVWVKRLKQANFLNAAERVILIVEETLDVVAPALHGDRSSSGKWLKGVKEQP